VSREQPCSIIKKFATEPFNAVQFAFAHDHQSHGHTPIRLDRQGSVTLLADVRHSNFAATLYEQVRSVLVPPPHVNDPDPKCRHGIGLPHLTSAQRVLARRRISLIRCSMWQKLRLFLLVLLIGLGLAQASQASISADTSYHMMAMQEECCPDDCPDMPECNAICVASMQCRAMPYVAGQTLSLSQSHLLSERARFRPVGQNDREQYAVEGLRKPPKT